MAVSASTNLSVTLAHAIAYLTRPLVATYSATTIIKLQSLLEANLTPLYAPTWSVKEPLRGSSRRCMTLSPTCLPPRSIYSACLAAGVQWFDWIAALGGREFDFYVDPGCVAVRYAPAPRSATPSQMVTIWADDVSAPVTAMATPNPEFKGFADTVVPTHKPSHRHSKTLAQQLLEEDRDEDDQLFSMIADQVSAPTWTSPILTHFPASTRSSSPLSSLSTHSRCSSRSSNSSSSGYSFASGDSSSAATSVSNSSGAKAEQKQSRRERARQARVFVDTSKTEVTPYDGGKTTVLTGGVMLGGGPKAGKPKNMAASPATTISNGWRSVRV